MCFPIHKGYYGKPTHHKGASYLFSGSKIKTAKPPAADRDALGLITIYTRPDEFSVKFTEPFPPLSICSKYPLPHQRKFHQKPY